MHDAVAPEGAMQEQEARDLELAMQVPRPRPPTPHGTAPHDHF